MGVEVSWENEDKRVIRYDLSGQWQWDEFYPAYQRASEMIAPLNYKVHFIVNPADEITRKGYVPPNLLSRLRDMNKNPLPNVGATYVIGSPVLKVLYNVGVKVFRSAADRYVYVSSLEEARTLVAERVSREQQEVKGSTR